MFGDKLKKIVKKKSNEKTNDKKIENLVFFIVIVIITIIVINFILKGDHKTTTENTTKNKQLAGTNTTENSGKDLEASLNSDGMQNLNVQLEEILKQIEGVGDVKVFVNYSETSETVAMYNENSKISNTQEEDTSGGIRKIEETDTQKEIIYQENNGEKIPITQKIISPKIEGAIITAKGAGDANVKANIIQAVEAATGLATHKIQVFTKS